MSKRFLLKDIIEFIPDFKRISLWGYGSDTIYSVSKFKKTELYKMYKNHEISCIGPEIDSANTVLDPPLPYLAIILKE